MNIYMIIFQPKKLQINYCCENDAKPLDFTLRNYSLNISFSLDWFLPNSIRITPSSNDTTQPAVKLQINIDCRASKEPKPFVTNRHRDTTTL